MRTAIYIRVSTDEQAKEGFSIPAQKERLTQYVQSQDWDIFDYYIDEGVSAKDTNRPELQRLMSDIRQRKLDVVLVYKLDRLTRSVLDLYSILQELERYDVKFKSATEVYDTTSAIGRLFLTLVAALAQWERENLAERVRFGMEQMVHQAKRPGGRPPFGYDLVDGELKINEDQAKIVRFIFDRYLSGVGFDGTAVECNQLGFRTGNGAEFSKTTIMNILQNQSYYGALRWNTRVGGRGNKVKPEDEWIIIDNVHPAIIDRESWERVQFIIGSRKLKHPRALASDFVFSGQTYCARCGGQMNGKTSRHQSKDYAMYHYVCVNVRKKKCDAPMVPEHLLEKFFIERLTEFANEFESAAHTSSRKKPKKEKTEGNRPQIEKELSKITDKRKRMQIAFTEGLIEIDELRDRINELREQENYLKEQLNESTVQDKALSPTDIHSIIVNIKKVWPHATKLEKKQLVSILVNRMAIEIDDEERLKRIKTVHIKELVFN